MSFTTFLRARPLFIQEYAKKVQIRLEDDGFTIDGYPGSKFTASNLFRPHHLPAMIFGKTLRQSIDQSIVHSGKALSIVFGERGSGKTFLVEGALSSTDSRGMIFSTEQYLRSMQAQVQYACIAVSGDKVYDLLHGLMQSTSSHLEPRLFVYLPSQESLVKLTMTQRDLCQKLEVRSGMSPHKVHVFRYQIGATSREVALIDAQLTQDSQLVILLSQLLQKNILAKSGETGCLETQKGGFLPTRQSKLTQLLAGFFQHGSAINIGACVSTLEGKQELRPLSSLLQILFLLGSPRITSSLSTRPATKPITDGNTGVGETKSISLNDLTQTHQIPARLYKLIEAQSPVHIWQTEHPISQEDQKSTMKITVDEVRQNITHNSLLLEAMRNSPRTSRLVTTFVEDEEQDLQREIENLRTQNVRLQEEIIALKNIHTQEHGSEQLWAKIRELEKELDEERQSKAQVEALHESTARQLKVAQLQVQLFDKQQQELVVSSRVIAELQKELQNANVLLGMAQLHVQRVKK